MSLSIRSRTTLLDSLAAAARGHGSSDETLLAVGAGTTEVGVRTDSGMGWWFLAVPLTSVQRRRRLSLLSRKLGWSQPRNVGVVVTSRRVLIFRRRIAGPPALVAEIPAATVTAVDRPTVGGYLRTLRLRLSEGRLLTLRLRGDEADSVAAALRRTMTAA